ncbi:MAG: hypothetical protein ACJA0S_000432 [Rickettsiales bacterium]|jgi:hypothetical protein
MSAAASTGGGQSSFQQMLASKRDEDSDSGGPGGLVGESGHGGAGGFSTPVFSDKIDILGGNHEDLLSSAAGNINSAFGTLSGSVDFDFAGPFDHFLTGSAKGMEDLQLHELSSGEDMGAGAHVNSASRSAGMGITDHGKSS